MNRKTLVWLLVFVALVAAALIAWRWPRPATAETVEVRRMAIAQTIVATGRVNTPARIELAAEITAAVQAVPVREGDTVRAGQTVLQLHDDEARAALAQAQGALQEAQGRASQLDQVGEPVSAEAVTQARANLRNAEAEHQRARELVAKGFFAQQRMDDAQRALDTARSALNAAMVQAQANRTGGVERQLAQARVQQARAAADAAQARLVRTRIAAPADALVLERRVEPGTLAQPGRVLLVLAAQGGTRIDAQVDEKHLSLLRKGLGARVVADAWPSQAFDAQLDYVAPSIDAQRGSVEVRLQVARPPAFLRPDMTVSVEMQVGQASDALVLPADAVRDADSAAPWALVARDGVATRAALKLGLQGVGSVQVLQGLAEGDRVVVATAPVAEGDRIRPVARAARARGFELPQGLAN